MDRSELNAVLKNVHDALRLDEDNKFMEAYGKYVECMRSIANKLWLSFTNTDGGILVRNVLNRYVTLGQQCMERISIILEKVEGSPTQALPSKNLKSSRITLSNENLAPLSTLHNSSVNTYTKPVDMSPMAAAQKQNQQLLFAYKARMAQQNQGRKQHDLALTLQRKMVENIAIAKAREISLSKKMNERQKRLEKEATRRFSLPTKLSKEQENRKQIFKKTLDYEMDVKWLQNIRQKVSQDPKNPEVIKYLIQSIFRCVDHPLTALLNKYQQKVLRNLLRLTQSRSFEVSQIKVPLNVHKNTSSLQLEGDSAKPTGELTKQTPSLEDTSCNDDSRVQENRTACDRNEQETGKQSNEPFSEDKQVEDSITESTSMKDMEDETLEDVIISSKEQLLTALEVSNEMQENLIQEQKMLNKVKLKTVNLAQFTETSKDEESDDMCSSSFDESSLLKSYSSSEVIDESVYILKLTDDAYQRHLHNISKDILLYNEKIMKMFIICYEGLDSAEGRDQIYACIEEMFFKPIWPHLLLLFRIVHRDEEYKAAQVMTDYQNVMPQDVDVAPNLCLEQSSTSGQFPYQSAVEELRSVKDLTAPLMKMECLVRVIRQVCQCIADYQHPSHTGVKSNTEDHAPTVGADDLLPILHYVLIRSELPELVSECAAIEELIHEGYLLGEGGYCLTSFQTALGYLTSLSSEKVFHTLPGN
ncbi:Hypothetical predicted protein [Octopus vulgaris]|uniref:VPS9 domain-containing protein n=1 Tax=Octopus vulgaris TaxID=6645 RepID=A0AA36AJ92_OCTVU|nr:Hypothetical predicted protein [Octopus vulgaris]